LILKILKRKIKNIKTVLSVHVGDINEVFKKIPNILKSTTIKNINENCDLVLLLSKEIESQFIDNGIDLSKIRVIANFHDLQIEDNLNVIKNDKEDKLNLLFVGSLQTDKGIFELLQAVEDLSKENIYLDICGKFPDNESYKMYSKIIHKSKNKINNNGYVSGNNKSQIFEKADVLILPSYHEGFPLVILEAIASGCAVISTKVGATPEILNDSNAIWVEKKSVSDIKNAILELITNRNKLNIMKLNNLILSKKYSKKTNINNVCKEYNKLING
jgi:glycosyltransferase involved in cell wall biosynthesis